jgi:hypothetical protein
MERIGLVFRALAILLQAGFAVLWEVVKCV